MIDAMNAWVLLLQTTPAVTALVSPARIRYEIDDIEIPLVNSWITVSSVSLRLERGFWNGVVQLTFFAPQGHIGQAIQAAVIESLGDALLNCRIHRIAAGSQEGAVVTVGEMFALSRGRMPISGDVELPFRSINVQTKVSALEMSWA